MRNNRDPNVISNQGENTIMSEDNKDHETGDFDRRNFLKAGAAGIAAAGTAGLATDTASAQTIVPDQEKL
jgi:hypothetical protein